MSLWQDIRLAGRLLVKDKWFTVVAALALALGIGVNTTVFTFANAVVLRGLPFTDPDSLVSIAMTDARGRFAGVSRLDFLDWRSAAQSFSQLAMFTGASLNVSEQGRPAEQYNGTYGSANFFELIGQRPQLGRDLAAADDTPGAEPVVILSDSVWKSRYAAGRAVLGRALKVNDRICTIIGVMPPEMKFPFNNDMWLPFAMFLLEGTAITKFLRRTAAYWCAALHIVAGAGTLTLLRGGSEAVADIRQRIGYLNQNPDRWRLGWLLWMLAALSLAGFYTWWSARTSRWLMPIAIAALGLLCSGNLDPYRRDGRAAGRRDTPCELVVGSGR